jgi:hypothetical protein
MEKLNRKLLTNVKQAFVAMPAGADPMAGAGPVAGGGMMTQAQAAPMGGDPAAMGGMPMDPAMMGGAPPMDPAAMGGDPAAMGGAPMDPAAMGGMPPMDPAMMGGDPAAMGGEPPPGQITMSAQEFTEILQTLVGAVGGAKPKVSKSSEGGDAGGDAGAAGGGVEGKLDTIIGALGLGGSAPPM